MISFISEYFLVIIFVITLLSAFWLLMIVDLIFRKFEREGERAMWTLILIFLYVLGAVLYYICVRLGIEEEKDNVRKK